MYRNQRRTFKSLEWCFVCATNYLPRVGGILDDSKRHGILVISWYKTWEPPRFLLESFRSSSTTASKRRCRDRESGRTPFCGLMSRKMKRLPPMLPKVLNLHYTTTVRQRGCRLRGRPLVLISIYFPLCSTSRYGTLRRNGACESSFFLLSFF